MRSTNPVCLCGLLCASALSPAQTVESHVLPVPAGPDGASEIPLTIIRGVRPGPALALIAGNHGYEYPPILALQQLRTRIDPNRLAGTVYLVHIANLPSFQQRTIYVSPIDHKNLNRVYPGKLDGTLSERIAFVLTREVIEKSTHLLDLHAGDGNESLRPYVYQAVTGDRKMDEAIGAMALAFGLDHIILDRNRPTDSAKSLYCSTTAITRGRPAITVESGYLGTTDAQSVQAIVGGVENILRHLKMTDGTPDAVTHPIYLDPSEVLASPATGILYPHVERGQQVAKGTLLAHVTDYFGKRIGEVRAPFAGEVLYVVTTPPIQQGQPVAFVGFVKQ